MWLPTFSKKVSTLFSRASSKNGYGLALIMVFILSTVLVGTSMSLILAPNTANFMGSGDTIIARQVALIGLSAAQSDIMTQMETGTTITTAYRYPASGTNSVSIPTYPGSGSTISVGNYYVTITKARGYTYLLQATATVNGSSSSTFKLVQVSVAPDIMSSALAIYSLRKAKSSYSGSAVRVRCAYTGTTTDIGFDAEGDFDVAGLRSCLGDSTLPLDVTTGEKVAYGFRKLSSSYSDFALKVRRSSDDFTQDIGFDADGNLDTVALKSFVGSSSGYIDTWYDQSGSDKDLTQTSLTKQPRIVNAGVIETKNNQLSAYFDGINDSLSNTTLGGTLITGAEIRSFVVSSTESGGNNPDWGEFAVLYKSGDPNAYSTAASMEILCMAGSPSGTATTVNSGGGDGTGITTGVVYQHTSYHNASNNLRLYRNGSLLPNASSVSANLAPTSIIMGTSAGSDATTNVRGYISELIIFNSMFLLLTSKPLRETKAIIIMLQACKTVLSLLGTIRAVMDAMQRKQQLQHNPSSLIEALFFPMAA
jgi:hypothetical protein